jgi:hypothetical protein
MKKLLVPVILLFSALTSQARTLEVGPFREFLTLPEAVAQVQPGDTILIYEVFHQGDHHFTDLKGTEDKWITIKAAPGAQAVFLGGSVAFQLTDPAYLRIEGLIFEGQTGNGVNIDDGGTYETPAHHIVIDGCEWRSMDATGNNDELKMSGIDDFIVRNCKFSNGSAGGSLIDMVGCHRGEFIGNTFQNAGSNCIQAKGGTSEILIHRNRFLQGGQRAINIGGSTGLQFFRPLDAKYEAKNIWVYSNFFEGSVAPIAYVGAVDCKVVNNTIIRPERWAIRILQETIEDFLPCGNNSFINNIVVFNSMQPAINIGGNTAPETFTFSNNLWYNPDNANWSGPNTPVNEPGRILNQDPQFISLEYTIPPFSPAAGAGLAVEEPEYDLHGWRFMSPRSIGALEVEAMSVNREAEARELAIYPNPVASTLRIEVDSEIRVLNALGREFYRGREANVDVSSWPAGSYTVLSESGNARFIKR